MLTENAHPGRRLAFTPSAAERQGVHPERLSELGFIATVTLHGG